MRTFIAIQIKLNPRLLETIDAIKRELEHENLKWVDAHVLHLTLKFLGETNESQVQQISDALSVYINNTHHFSIKLEGMSFFKSNRNPRVLFFKIPTHDDLNQLVAGIENILFSFGFEKESRPFVPHLTIARIKYLNDKERFYTLIENFTDRANQIVDVEEIIFYQSILNPGGSVYKELAVFPLHSV